MAKVSVVDPNGYTLKLDANRQAIADTFVAQLYDNNGALGREDGLQGRRRAADLRRRVLADEPAPERVEPGVQAGQRAVEGHEGLVSE